MSQLPMMPLWCADFFTKTDHLTNEEQWAYLKLMMKTWVRNCQPFPDNDQDIARLLGMSLKQWRHVRPRIEPFFNLRDNRRVNHWVQPKLEEAFLSGRTRLERNRANGMLGGRPVSNKTNGLTKPTVSVQDTQPGTPDERQSSRRKSSTPQEGTTTLSSAREATPPPATLTGVGSAAPHASPNSQEEPDTPSALEDPEVRAEAIAAFDACLSALRGKAGTLAADALPTTQESDPRIAEFRARIRRLNDLASNALTGQTRTHAWEVLARADALEDPDDLPPTLADDLNAIDALATEAQQ